MTKKQREFIDYYYTYRNASLAAELAGYSKKNCRQIGYDLLTHNMAVRKEISERLKAVGQYLSLEESVTA